MGEIAQPMPRETWSDDELFALVCEASREELDAPEPSRALELLFERHHARVRAQCSRLLGDSELADDVTQDIFLGLLEKPRHYEGRQSFSSWLYIVVKNRCLNVLRHRRKEIPRDPSEPWPELLVDPHDPEQDSERAELCRVLEDLCAEHLTFREQQVVHLRYVWGLRVKQINDVLDLKNISGARTHLATATRKLQNALAAKVGDEGFRSLPREG